jgi:hypothetical protein
LHSIYERENITRRVPLGHLRVVVRQLEQLAYSAASGSTMQKLEFPEPYLDQKLCQEYILPCTPRVPEYNSEKRGFFVTSLCLPEMFGAPSSKLARCD